VILCRLFGYLTYKVLYGMGFGNWVGLNCRITSHLLKMLHSPLSSLFLHSNPMIILSVIYFSIISTISSVKKPGYTQYLGVSNQVYLGYNCHMSEYLDYTKNPHMRAILDQIRQKNKSYMSICYLCGNKSIGIIAEGYLLHPACSEHMI